MNTPSPLIPQGALPNARGRSHIRIAVFTILAVHVVLLGALLTLVWFFAQAKNHRAFESGKTVASRSTLDADSVRE